jgi:DNA-binding transcriptional MerR regulator
MYTVKQLSRLAGVSVRTLHYYDEIGLLKPAVMGRNRYRYYSDADLLRLQQILFYREMDLELIKIREMMDRPGFNQTDALRSHRRALQAKIDRLNTLIRTVDATLLHLTGEKKMSQNQIFEGFTPEEEKKYNEEAVNRWGDTAKESIKLWNDYSEQQKKEIMAQGKEIYQQIVAKMSLGPGSPEIQAALARWHAHLRYFYKPTPQMLRGLGDMYAADPAFRANIAAMHPDLPDFLKQAINIYVDSLEGKGK